MLSFEDFKKAQLAVARILEVKEHPNADRLYVLKISLGEEERQIVAGIRPFYAPEQLLGRQIVVVANLEPAMIRGEESKGMLLAVGDEKGISIIGPDREVSLGSPVR
jgi:methionyl-tRNA synthetase